MTFIINKNILETSLSMRLDILTLFPAMFRGILDSSIIAIAIQKKLVDIRLSNIRNFSYERHRQVDDIPYGGGPGMLIKPEPIFRAVEAVIPTENVLPDLILLTPQGQVFTQEIAKELSQKRHIIFICGHYEGFDERIRIGLKPREISIGDYILSGGEIGAMVILDAIIRLIPGALGDEQSPQQESFSNANLLEYAQYTRPPIFRGMAVPEILISGHHRKIREWQLESAKERTRQRRPDLWANIFANNQIICGENPQKFD